MNTGRWTKSATSAKEGKRQPHILIYLNAHQFISITVLHPCLPLLFSMPGFMLCSSMALSQGSRHFHSGFESTEFGDYYINTMCSYFSISSAYCKQSMALTSPGVVWKAFYHPQAQPVIDSMSCTITNTQIWKSSTDSLLPVNLTSSLFYEGNPRTWKGKGIPLLPKAPT